MSKKKKKKQNSAAILEFNKMVGVKKCWEYWNENLLFDKFLFEDVQPRATY